MDPEQLVSNDPAKTQDILISNTQNLEVSPICSTQLGLNEGQQHGGADRGSRPAGQIVLTNLMVAVFVGFFSVVLIISLARGLL